MSLNALLSVLADGEWHSGEELAALVGVSRAAVWKQLKALDSYNAELEAGRGQGYRLKHSFTPLNADVISAAVANPLLAKVSTDWQLESTNDAVQKLARDGGTEGRFVAAFSEHQTAGRGRRGRAWQAPLGGSILMSLQWQLEAMPANPAAAALVAGLAVAESLKELLAESDLSADVALKWPNDVYVNNRKIAGILCEMRGDPSSECHLVIGVGLNFGLGGLASQIDQAVTDCESLGLTHGDRPVLAAKLLSRLMDFLQEFESSGFAPFRQQWKRLDWLAGKPVRVILSAETHEGTAISVSEDGGLLVDHNGKIHRHIAGEVSVRRT